ncbi:MAG: hypothetical protein AUJ34_00525 [Parcubacteria group bacterium CG1_02_41_12]|nr:MAG: hypothetical protein AUJ34_00525 [Parcubacteria group bacterium CG1_02_41_12]PIQ79840.1 MAG: hypothetical protein COV79_02995 [Parcubacteria group bacterium CG11_big_fil_rev_8_21_14_0_20_41_14]PIR57487.1 MAG: hypothetical protein COU72_00665 [Parcubacteria group bacterium CG10_big_fil_rev_8_21_14_0_10_41_35]
MEEEVEVITGRVVRVSDTTSQETSGSFVSGAKRHYTYETKSGKKFLLNTGEVVSISCVDDAILFTTHGDSVTVVWKTKGGHRWKGSSFINHDINMSWEQKW